MTPPTAAQPPLRRLWWVPTLFVVASCLPGVFLEEASPSQSADTFCPGASLTVAGDVVVENAPTPPASPAASPSTATSASVSPTSGPCAT